MTRDVGMHCYEIVARFSYLRMIYEPASLSIIVSIVCKRDVILCLQFGALKFDSCLINNERLDFFI